MSSRDVDLALRPAQRCDAELLYHWRNDPQTRRASRRQDVVGWGTHLRWLERVLVDDHRRLMIAEFEGRPVGTVRIDEHDGECELSWTVAPKERGRGHGTALVCAAARLVDSRLVAFVREDNVHSQSIARRAGFELESVVDGMQKWARTKRA